jgi:hypothetical protein
MKHLLPRMVIKLRFVKTENSDNLIPEQQPIAVLRLVDALSD